LWATLWLAALATALGGPLGPGRMFASGVLLGATFATSMKTSLLFATLLAAVALSAAMDPRGTARLRVRRAWTSIGACVAGMAAVCLLILVLFAWLGALPELVHFVLAHNLAATARWNHRAARVAMFVLTFPLLVAISRALLRRSSTRAFARCAVWIAALLYVTALNGFWPIVTRQDFLPFYPVLAVFVIAASLETLRVPRRQAAVLLASVATAEALLTLWVSPLRTDGTRFHVGLVADVLRLTARADPVMDLKGETLFRRRPFFYALEDVTRQRLQSGELRDDIAERLIATRTYVSVVDSTRFPPAARRFLLDNYVPVGHLRVAGKLLDIDAGGGAFTIAIPGRYVMLSPSGPIGGLLDGRPLEGSRELEATPHTFQPSPPAPAVAVVWADAAEAGFSPFHPGALP